MTGTLLPEDTRSPAERIGPVDRQREVTLLDLADRLLDRGVVVAADVTITVADVELIHVSLRALLTSAERAARLPGVAERFGPVSHPPHRPD